MSISFACPEKNGWHFEHVLTCIDLDVERVSTTLPHAHTIVAGPYSGWMSFFISPRYLPTPGLGFRPIKKNILMKSLPNASGFTRPKTAAKYSGAKVR